MSEFDYDEYLVNLKESILMVLNRKRNNTNMSDHLLDVLITEREKKCSKYVKQLQMNIGEIWQIAIGEYKGYKNLRVGHISKMDVYCKKTNTYIELKNRFNTDNSSSRSANYNKMVNIIRKDQTATCIYGIINDKNKRGNKKEIVHKGYKIYIYSGERFLKHIFGKKYDDIMQYIIDVMKDWKSTNSR